VADPVVVRRPIGDHPPKAHLYYGTDCREVLRVLPEGSIQCVVTSPPYWGLRDYGAGSTQIGLERTPEKYVEHLVEVFREVRRVLREDGTLWLNLGDTYAQARGHGHWENRKDKGDEHGQKVVRRWAEMGAEDLGLKPKDLVGIPWRMAFALQADGWYLRSDVIWAKTNPMPESVADRPTKAHEYVFLMSKSARYFYDLEAIREPVSANWEHGAGAPMPELGAHVLTEGRKGHQAKRTYDTPKGANRRTVWSIGTQPFPGAHFAVMPPALVEPCVLAGSRVGDTVLDPFSGSGTTGMVALSHGRDYVGIDINSDYLELARARLLGEDPPATEQDDDPGILEFFA